MPDRADAHVLITLADGTDPVAPVPWAVSMLREALAEKGIPVWTDESGPSAAVVRAEVLEGLGPAEAFLIEPGPSAGEVLVRAGGARGLAHGLTELADRVRHSADPVTTIRTAESALRAPAVAVRGVLRAFSSDVLDRPWLCDRDFWKRYLDELALHRINRLHLALGMQYNYSHDDDVRDNYLCFAYPFLLPVPGWEGVGVAGLSQRERAENLAALRFASAEAQRRGVHFQLGLWNHAVRPELVDSPNLRYPVHGLADEEVAEYSAAGLRELLRECPSIDGLTFRVHYEGGVPEAGRAAFWRTVLSGLRDAGRPLDVDLHAKGVDQDLLDAAQATGAHVVVSAKYWAEHQGLPYHQAAVRPLEAARPADGDGLRGITQNTRRFTRYGYGDFLRLDRNHDLLFRVWPGSQRFLLWADPELFAGYGRMSGIAGALGAELCEPLTFRGRKDTGRGATRDLYADPTLRLGTADWRKYSYEYGLWGRLMFDPDSEPESWLRELRTLAGDAAEDLAAALSAAGKVLPLVTVTQTLSASNNFFWPEVFTDLPIARAATSETYGFDLAAPGTWGTVSPLDPELFESADDYAHGLVTRTPSGKCTPDQVATWLDGFATDAEAALARARRLATDASAPGFRRIALDVTIELLLARFFAGKIRAGVGYSLFRETKDPRHLREGLEHYRSGRNALAEIVTVAEGVYAANLAFGDRPTEQGHWRDRLGQIDRDLDELRRELDEAVPPEHPVEIRPARTGPRPAVTCVPPAGFVRGEPLVVRAEAAPGIELTLRVRHLNQAEAYQDIAMTADREGGFTAEIPPDRTTGAYPIAFFLVARSTAGPDAWIVPGLDKTLANQPYHVVLEQRG
ncbi:hypothetical protein [Amycolatopsis dongchuanensis]|uniref:Uncharacterized protein n=1 Tax=Amycolatopsis dongchuanensis TaxID=1070866 RepID=A0ABP9QIX9_9PSEU